MLALHLAVSILPVLLFLAALHAMDSFKLVEARPLAFSILAGAFASGLAYVLNTGLQASLDLSALSLTRYAGPVVEEVLKGGIVAFLILRHRVGFLVDAAIHGFAVGAGFACVENMYYVGALPDATIWTWVVRGLGTAIMHGGTGVVAASITKLLVDRASIREGTVERRELASDSPSGRAKRRAGAWVAIPGIAAAIAVHSAFNHFPFNPLVMTALLMVLMPPLVAFVYARSENATRSWITTGFDSDQELLRLITAGSMADSRVGRYLAELRSRFPGPVIVDMLCLLQLEMELSIHAKGLLMMREAGFNPPGNPGVEAKLAEIDYLEDSIGPVGMRAIDPFLRTSGQDRWQRRVLQAQKPVE